MDILITGFFIIYLSQIVGVITFLILNDDLYIFKSKKDILKNLIPFYYIKPIFSKLIINLKNLG